MSSRAIPLPSPFTASERDLIRREMGMHFGQYPSLAEGLFLRTWRGGPQKGEPKIPPAVQSMLARGLVELHSQCRQGSSEGSVGEPLQPRAQTGAFQRWITR